MFIEKRVLGTARRIARAARNARFTRTPECSLKLRNKSLVGLYGTRMPILLIIPVVKVDSFVSSNKISTEFENRSRNQNQLSQAR